MRSGVCLCPGTHTNTDTHTHTHTLPAKYGTVRNTKTMHCGSKDVWVGEGYALRGLILITLYMFSILPQTQRHLSRARFVG